MPNCEAASSPRLASLFYGPHCSACQEKVILTDLLQNKETLRSICVSESISELINKPPSTTTYYSFAPCARLGRTKPRCGRCLLPRPGTSLADQGANQGTAESPGTPETQGQEASQVLVRAAARRRRSSKLDITASILKALTYNGPYKAMESPWISLVIPSSLDRGKPSRPSQPNGILRPKGRKCVGAPMRKDQGPSPRRKTAGELLVRQPEELS